MTNPDPGSGPEDELAALLALLGHDGASAPASWFGGSAAARRGRPQFGESERSAVGSAGGLTVCGHTGVFGGVAHCWFARDGRVYDPDGNSCRILVNHPVVPVPLRLPRPDLHRVRADGNVRSSGHHRTR